MSNQQTTLVRVVDGALTYAGMVGKLVGVDYQADRHNPVVVEFDGGGEDDLKHHARFARWQIEGVGGEG